MLKKKVAKTPAKKASISKLVDKPKLGKLKEQKLFDVPATRKEPVYLDVSVVKRTDGFYLSVDVLNRIEKLSITQGTDFYTRGNKSLCLENYIRSHEGLPLLKR